MTAMPVAKRIVAVSMLFLFQTVGGEARERDAANPAWVLGQVVYFAARCPSLRTGRVRETIDQYCPSSGIAPADCEAYKAATFKAQAEAGASRLEAEFKNADAAQACRAALERYGPRGSIRPGMLRIRR